MDAAGATAMGANIAGQPEVERNDVLTYRFTFGNYNQTDPWTDVRDLTWPEIASLLTQHTVGAKEGSCVVPAIFRGAKRHKADAQRIDVAFLDSDAGTTLAEIAAAIDTFGWTGIISSTHSHLTTSTRVKCSNWEKFHAAAADQDHAPANFLVKEKGYLSRIAEGAGLVSDDGEYVTIQHQACPKFRVIIPLQRPWCVDNYDDQDHANVAWKERIEALAAALHLDHDQSCVDTSRLFFLPRRPTNGPLPETLVLSGVPCDIFALPSAVEDGPEGAGASDTDTKRRGGTRDATPFVFTDPETGEVADLRIWARDTAGRFEIERALRVRRPQSFTGKVGDEGKHHIRCVNDAAHTEPGADAATMIINASASTNRGFVYHCRHAHCDGRDRLFFVWQMLEQGWLTVGDLSHPNFQMEPATRAQDDADIELTEHGVAVTFVRHSQRTLRYCHSAGAWYVWSGAHWTKNNTRFAFDAARRLVAALNRKSEFKTRAITGRAAFANAVERFAQADQTLAVTASVWNPDPWLLATPDGTVDLRTGISRPAQPQDYMTRLTAVAPADIAACPQFLTFLQQTSGNDVPMMEFLQRWFGYCLTGITREHALIFLYGPGGNGKGVLLQTIGAILKDYATTAAMETFTEVRGERHSTDLAMLHGARLVMATETDEGQAWAEARIKALTGGDPITARFMRRDFFTFTPAFKLTISGNHKPTLRNVDDAARRRLNVVPFLNKPLSPDSELADKLKTEWPGILRWMIEGCLAWQREGLVPPSSVIEATGAYFFEQDIFAQWIDERCEVGTGLGASNDSLVRSWRSFVVKRGEEPRTSRWLGASLDRLGYRRGRDCDFFRGRGFLGIRPMPE